MRSDIISHKSESQPDFESRSSRLRKPSTALILLVLAILFTMVESRFLVARKY